MVVKFTFYDEFLKDFQWIKEKLVYAPIIMAPYWSKSFKVICDASVVALVDFIIKKKEKLFHPIYCTSISLNGAQKNYTVMEQELLVLVYALKKFSNI